MSTLKISLLWVLLALLVSCGMYKMEATKTQDDQQPWDDAIRESHAVEPQEVVSLTQTAFAKKPELTDTHIYLTVVPTSRPVFSTPSLTIGASQVSTKDGMLLMYVPAGEFLMGSLDSDHNATADEKPRSTVYLDTFWIDQTEVTNAQYTLCVQAGTCLAPLYDGSNTRDSYFSYSQYANYPVVFVTWDDAFNYCKWVDRRLPTEAEWEKAARGPDGRTYPWGEGIDCTRAN